MPFIPSQGFRHAATLLLTNRVRAIAAGASPDAVRTALERLAHDLVALADDTRAPAETSGWLIEEFSRAIDRLPQPFDRASAKATAAEVLAHAGARVLEPDARDLFLIYAPEDRLPIAAPLAVELTKRRISVALAEYEVASAGELAIAVAHGLARHRGGVILATPAFDRARCGPPTTTDRLRIVRHVYPPSALADLMEWVTQLRVSKG